MKKLKIGVVSDTHMFSRSRKLPDRLVKGLTGVDLILHAGDFTDPAVIPLLEKFAPLEAVAGNNDGSSIVKRFGYSKVLTLGGKRIGLVHGHQGPGRTTEEKALRSFKDQQVDVIVFGHSHNPYVNTVNGILLFNPGSPTDKRFLTPKFSFGILEIGESVKASHIFYSDKS